jgi:large repetitive protein
VTLTATVTAADGKGTPTGTANFLSNGKSVGSAKLDNKGTATLPLEKGLTAASHSITAGYQGDKSYDSSTSTSLKITVTK